MSLVVRSHMLTKWKQGPSMGLRKTPSWGADMFVTNILKVTSAFNWNTCRTKVHTERALPYKEVDDRKPWGTGCMACSHDVKFAAERERERDWLHSCASLQSLCGSFTFAPPFLFWLLLHNGDLPHEPLPWWQVPEDREQNNITQKQMFSSYYGSQDSWDSWIQTTTD